MAHDITMRVLFGKLGLERLEHLDEYLLELEPVKTVENDAIEDMVDEIVEDTTDTNHEMLMETPDNEIHIEELIDDEPFIETEFEEPFDDYNQFEDYENFDDYEQFYGYDDYDDYE